MTKLTPLQIMLIDNTKDRKNKIKKRIKTVDNVQVTSSKGVEKAGHFIDTDNCEVIFLHAGENQPKCKDFFESKCADKIVVAYSGTTPILNDSSFWNPSRHCSISHVGQGIEQYFHVEDFIRYVQKIDSSNCTVLTKGWIEYIIVEILLPFMPLHLSLQAFFGISRDDNGNWIELSKAEDIDDQWRKTFPNKNAFLLVPEAEWDFYASIFDRLMPPEKCRGMKKELLPSCDEEKLEYNQDKNLANLLAKLMEHLELKHNNLLISLHSAFCIDYPLKITTSSNQFFELKDTHGSRNVTYVEFVNSLREISAILANTCTTNCKKEGTSHFFGYKGQNDPKEIVKQINKDDYDCHCKLEKCEKDYNIGYSILNKQIEKWGIEKAKVVIAGIEELANYLAQTVDVNNNG